MITPATAEKMLWRAVLEQAVVDFACFGYERRSDLTLARRSAASWFVSNDRGLESFFYVCDVLSINPAWFRKQLRATSVDALKDRLVKQPRNEGKLPDIAAPQGEIADGPPRTNAVGPVKGAKPADLQLSNGPNSSW